MTTTPASSVRQPSWQSLINPSIDTGWNPTPGSGQRNDYSVALPQDTPIVAPVSGIVLPQNTSGGGLYSYYGRQVWGGEVDILTSMADYPGGLQNVNVLHFNTIAVKPGDTVVAGQTVLGTSGGQTSGGTMPSSPTYSTGPHIGVGVHSAANWNQMWNPQTLIANLQAGTDRSALPAQNQLQGAGLGWLPRNALAGGLPPGTPTLPGTTGTAGSGTPGSPGYTPPPPDPCSQYAFYDPRNWWCNLTNSIGQQLIKSNWFWRTGKVLLGVGLIVAGVGVFLVGSLGGDIAAAAATASGVPEAAPFLRRAYGKRTNATRRVGNFIQARGARAGQETLKAREQKGKETGRGEVLQLFKNWGKEGAAVAQENRKRKEQGLPPLPSRRHKNPKAPVPKPGERQLGNTSPEEEKQMRNIFNAPKGDKATKKALGIGKIPKTKPGPDAETFRAWLLEEQRKADEERKAGEQP